MNPADLNRISLASWDWIVIGLFFLGMLWICFDVARKRKETSGEYFLNGRTATGWPSEHPYSPRTSDLNT